MLNARPPQYLAFFRHGESVANVVTQVPTDAHYYTISGSDPEVGLTDNGLAQSLETGRVLARLFPKEAPIDSLWLSPFRRVDQSADQVDKALGYSPARKVDKRLSKRSYGAFWNLTYKGLEDLHPEEWAAYLKTGKFLYRAPGGGENYPDVFARVADFIAEEVNPSTENMAIGTHSVVMLAVERQFEGLSDGEVVRRYEEVSLPNGHVVLYVRGDPSQPWRRCPIAVEAQP